jgi:hypothetical protein
MDCCLPSGRTFPLTHRKENGVTQFAETPNWDEYAEQVPEKYLACRAEGQHHRIPGTIEQIKGTEKFPNARWAITKRCRNRCGVVWIEFENAKGSVIWKSGPRYAGAPGYPTKGLGRFTVEARDRMRLERNMRYIQRQKGK